MNLAYAVKRAPSSESTSLARWVLFPIHHFPSSDFHAAVDAHVRIGRSGLLGAFISRHRKPAVKSRGTRLRSELESRLWAWGLPIGTWSLGYDLDGVWFLSDKEVGLHFRKKGLSRNYARGSCKFRRHLSELGVSSSEY